MCLSVNESTLHVLYRTALSPVDPFRNLKKIFYTMIRPATRRRESDPARHPAEEENCSVIASSRVCRNAAAAYAPAMAT